MNLGSHPDTLSDARIGVDVRIVGGPHGRFRFGAGAQLFVPNGDRADYDHRRHVPRDGPRSLRR